MLYKKVAKVLRCILTVLVVIIGFTRGQVSPTTETPLPVPSNVQATAIDSTSVDVRWDPVTDSRIVGYNVECGTNGQVGYTERVNGRDTSQTIIGGLQPNTLYTVMVYSRTSDETTSPPGFDVTKTLEDVPSSSPQDVAANALSTSTVMVTWSEVPEDNKNGVILGYRINYSKQGESSVQLDTLEVEGEDNMQENVTGLEANTEYVFSVLAYTSVGDGLPSDGVHETTWPLPSTVRISTSDEMLSTSNTVLSTIAYFFSSTQSDAEKSLDPNADTNPITTIEIVVAIGCIVVVLTATIATVTLYKCIIKNKNLVSPSV